MKKFLEKNISGSLSGEEGGGRKKRSEEGKKGRGVHRGTRKMEDEWEAESKLKTFN